MINSLRLRVIFVLSTICIACLFVLPNFPSISYPPLLSYFSKHTIRYGLDLQGGIFLILGVDVEKAVQANLLQNIEEARRSLKEQSVLIARPTVTSTPSKENLAQDVVISFALLTPSKEQILRDYLNKTFPEIIVTQHGTLLTARYTEARAQEIAQFALEQSIRTIRNRIDQFGVSEPDIRAQSDYRIQVQLPGLHDTKRAIALLGKTARLEFRVVRDDIPASTTVLPNDVVTLPVIDSNGTTLPVNKLVSLTGASIADARPTFDQNGIPDITLIFTKDGAELFHALTKESIGKRLAIVLDGVIYSAPVIREPIPGGRASISGNFTIQEARDLSVVLRAGALPAPVEVLEERTVGPSLGNESIRQGITASLIAALIVVVFMVLYYGWKGVLASCSMFLTLLFLLMGLGLFGATLTLPGIAGIILVLGMSVDANIIIYERIREEVRNGKKLAESIKLGFSKASVAIVDSNITTLLTAFILYQFGTGPIKGFAITLTLGILASMFSAMYIIRTFFMVWLWKKER